MIFSDASLKLKISASKSENELFTVIKNSNIDNSTALISLLKKQNKLCVNFALQNKTYAKLTKEKREKLLFDAFVANGIFPKNKNKTAKIASGDCLADYQNEMGDAVVNHILHVSEILSLAAVGVEVSGGVLSPEIALGTLVALAFEEIYFNVGVGNVIDKYEVCIGRACGAKRKPIKY